MKKFSVGRIYLKIRTLKVYFSSKNWNCSRIAKDNSGTQLIKVVPHLCACMDFDPFVIVVRVAT